MMQKYRVHELARFNYSDIGEYIDEYHTDRPLRNDILVDKLNEYDELDTKCSQLKEENEQLKKANDIAIDSLVLCQEKNSELKLRNNRQAKTIDNLYSLIENKDWDSLTAIITEIQEAEELNRLEFEAYCDGDKDD